MTSRKWILVLILLPLLALTDPANAAVSPDAIPEIWRNLTRTAGIQAGPVSLEKDREPNAWVAFQGDSYTVHITRGLLALMDRKDEVAGVLAHEIGHIQLGHYRDTVQRNLLWNLLFRVVDRKAVGGIDPVQLGLSLAEAGFSREQEVEADDYGVALATKAGYDPWGLYRSLQKMQEAGFETSASGFNSHPPTERRLLHVKNRTQEFAEK